MLFLGLSLPFALAFATFIASDCGLAQEKKGYDNTRKTVVGKMGASPGTQTQDTSLGGLYELVS